MGTLQDLSIPQPMDGTLPRWAREQNYPGRHEEMLRDLYQAGYWQEVRQLMLKNGTTMPDGATPGQWLETVLTEFPDDRDMILYRIASAAACKAAVQADFLRDDFERVFYEALWNISTRKLWAGRREEYQSLEEFLVDSIPRFREPGHESELSDALFMMEHFLPIMKNVGGDYAPEKLLAFQERWSRARRAVPYLRSKIRKVENSSDEISNGTSKGKAVLEDFQQAVDNTVRVIADQTIVRDGPAGISAKLFSMDGNEGLKPAPGYIALLPDKVVVFFVANASWQRAIERSLGNMVAFDSIDAEVGFQELDRLLHPKGRKALPLGK